MSVKSELLIQCDLVMDKLLSSDRNTNSDTIEEIYKLHIHCIENNLIHLRMMRYISRVVHNLIEETESKLKDNKNYTKFLKAIFITDIDLQAIVTDIPNPNLANEMHPGSKDHCDHLMNEYEKSMLTDHDEYFPRAIACEYSSCIEYNVPHEKVMSYVSDIIGELIYDKNNNIVDIDKRVCKRPRTLFLKGREGKIKTELSGLSPLFDFIDVIIDDIGHDNFSDEIELLARQYQETDPSGNDPIKKIKRKISDFMKKSPDFAGMSDEERKALRRKINLIAKLKFSKNQQK